MLNLKPGTLFLGQYAFRLEKINSTNDYLKDQARQFNLPEGTLIIADEQGAGKGQNGRSWSSAPGKNLLCSFLLYPADVLPYVSFAVSLGVRAVVQQHIRNKAVYVKWPNDILIDDRKIAGILIENISAGKKWMTIVGVGLNVNQRLWSDPEIRSTSLSLENQQSDFVVMDIARELCVWLEKYYLTLRKPDGVKQIHRLYVSQLYRLNEEVRIEGDEIPYVVNGVTSDGKLQLAGLVNGKILELSHNERKVIWN